VREGERECEKKGVRRVIKGGGPGSMKERERYIVSEFAWGGGGGGGQAGPVWCWILQVDVWNYCAACGAGSGEKAQLPLYWPQSMQHQQQTVLR